MNAAKSPPPLDFAVPQGAILCLGGSFNPPHHGHLVCARAVAEEGGFARVRLVVSSNPPHKPGDPAVIDARHRLAMTRLATEGDASFEVDDTEIRRDAPSYTLNTAQIFLERGDFPPPVYWLIGADLLAGLPKWHRAAELLAGRMVGLVVMRRPGYAIDWDALPPQVRPLAGRVVEVPQLDISATALRSRISAGQSIRYFVPTSVEDYIYAHNLYGAIQKDSVPRA